MDIPRNLNIASTWSGTDLLRRWGRKGLVTLLTVLILGDLVFSYLNGPTMTNFFPRLYTWIFVLLVFALVMSIMRALGNRWLRLTLGAVVALGTILTIWGTGTSFPFLAPGQTYLDVERDRKVEVKPLKVDVLGREVRPAAVGNRIDSTVEWMVRRWRQFFRNITIALNKALVPLERQLLQMPWWLFIALVSGIAWKAGGNKIALLAVLSLLFLGIFGLWDGVIRTLSVVGTATILSVAVAIPVGIAMSKSDRLQGALRPMLDMMQTMPAFVYLIPAIYFLGLGKVPAVMATMVYAMPPAMRLTNLGIRLVSPELVEAARAFGTTSWQLLFKIQLPLARPTIMAGVNQTIMMALAMVVLASMVGAKGLGYDILAGIMSLKFGQGLIAGIGIVVLAVIIDRITQGFAKDPQSQSGQ